MTRFPSLAALLVLAIAASVAHAGEEVRSCEYEVRARCTSGEVTVTLTNGAVSKLEVTVFYCGLRGHPGYSCTIDASRDGKDDVWSEENGATVISNGSPFNPDAPDRVKVTVGKYVSIDFSEAQSLGRCGAGAELPKAIVIPAANRPCRVFLNKD